MGKRVGTGITGLDEMLCGGFLPQSAVLVQGAAGVGKTTLGLQFLIHGAVQENEPGLLVTFEEFPESLYRDARSLGWELRDLEERGGVRILLTSPQVFLASLESPGSPLAELIRAHGIKRLVLDSMTHAHKLARSAEELREVNARVVNALKREEITSILLSEAPNTTSLALTDAALQAEGSLLFIVDGVLLLGFVEVDSVMFRALTVLKLRGSDHAKEIRRFEIGPGGIAVLDRFQGHEGVLTGAPRVLPSLRPDVR